MKFSKLKTLLDTLKFVYLVRPKVVVIRELLLIIFVALDIYLIRVWGQFIDATGHFLSTFSSFNLNTYFVSDSFFFLLLGTGIWLLIISIDKVRTFLSEDLEAHINYEIKTVYFEKISGSNLEDIESKEFRDLMTFTNYHGATNIWNTYRVFTEIVRNIATGITSLYILLSTFGFSSLIVVFLAIPETIWGYINRKKIRKYHNTELERVKWLDYIENLMTRIHSFPEMKVDGTFKNVNKEYGRTSYGFLSNILEMNKHLYIDTTLFSVLGKTFLMVYTIYMLSIAVVKKFTLGNFKAMYDYSYSAYNSFFLIFDMGFTISNYLEYGSKFFEFKNFKGFGDIAPGSTKLPKGTPDLALKSLDFQYPNQKNKVLEDLNINIKAGEKIMIIGDDGSGKSTLIKVLCGLYKVVSGDYEVGGYSVRELARGELKNRVSVIFQDYINYNMTLRRNITLSSEDSKIKQDLYQKVLSISGVDKLMDKFNIPDSQMLGKYVSRGKEVSSGFWQRIAIARMLYRNKDIFILDEPFTQIDNIEEERILKEMIKFAGSEKTIIYITRDNNHTHLFDSVYRLQKGKISKV